MMHRTFAVPSWFLRAFDRFYGIKRRKFTRSQEEAAMRKAIREGLVERRGRTIYFEGAPLHRRSYRRMAARLLKEERAPDARAHRLVKPS